MLLQCLNPHCCLLHAKVTPIRCDDVEGDDIQELKAKESSPSSRKHRQILPSCMPLSSRQSDMAGRRGPAGSACPPNILLLVSPNLLNRCAGRYILQAHAHANGQPLWEHERDNFWLFSTPKGHWALAGEVVKDGGFVRNSGWIYQESRHNGLMPDHSSSRWLLFNRQEGAFICDEAFEVTAPIEDGSILQAPDRNCEELQKSRKQQACCKPRFVIGALQFFKRR